ncbi:UvrD-helicase domain-containing protein [Acinetobacter sp. ANC 5033]|uniref:UvrD-helicase domain-containing protein n=1 Tax=Acinetobacter amyesii TaxID=2942470 RepID=UPI00201B7A66|nr:UvrD-helicase domain-containing protein [Acinetobacter amyesii]MCL6237641.1 UvrD-helicase domain-containing protein [Acinetobacter amyesii]
MNMPQQTMNMSTNPIADMSFTGLHWIEASAGTGKTYTLSSLMVRIFLDRYMPNQVIATTFTRKATAELKARVRLRIEETRDFIYSLLAAPQDELAELQQSLSDPLYQQVLKDHGHHLDYAYNRLNVVLQQYEELFVGTLDSFSQKLLREFAFESGRIEQVQISEDEDLHIERIIHDLLRDWIQQQPAHLIEYLLLNHQLKGPEYYLGVVKESLNFPSVDLRVPELPENALAHFEAMCHQLAQMLPAARVELAACFDAASHYKNLVDARRFNKGAFFVTFNTRIPEFLQHFEDSGSQGVLTQSDVLQPTMKAIRSLFYDPNKTEFKPRVFKDKIVEEQPDVSKEFYQHAFVQQLRAVLSAYEHINQAEQFLNFYLAQEVKKRLPQVLSHAGETTFSQQIRTLSEALQQSSAAGKDSFAAHVLARYPLILVDEFQDTNQDQDDMLSSIWRVKERLHQGCMIMVGDPKQAIYGFRGGDMLTYRKARHDIQTKGGRCYTLNKNHRSVKNLVEVVDALFHRQMDFGEQVEYTPIQAGEREHPPLIDHDQVNPQPLRWLALDETLNEAEQVAWQIQSLLNQAQQGHLYFQDNNTQRALTANDIAVLGQNHFDLEQVQQCLLQLGVPCYKASRDSVYKSSVAQDVAALLTAILNPYQEAKVKRALLSRLLGFDLKQLVALEQQADGLSEIIEKLEQIRQIWNEQGFRSAWNSCMTVFQVWTRLVAGQSRDNERTVVNLRHIAELLSQQSEHYTGAHKLYQWFIRQINLGINNESTQERKLTGQLGVQLMTIHASKGLEFGCVFLLGANAGLSEKGNLNFSLKDNQQKSLGLERVIAVKSSDLPDDDIQQNEARNEAEHHRLWYVALTRASYRVYAVLRHHEVEKKQVAEARSGLTFWRGSEPDLFQHAESVDADVLRAAPPILTQTQVEAVVLEAEEIPNSHFYPRETTSFTALTRTAHKAHIQRDQLAAAMTEPEASAADEVEQLEIIEAETAEKISWIKRHFPKGTKPGSFLHKLMEKVRFSTPEDKLAKAIASRFHSDVEFDSPQILQNLIKQFGQTANPEQDEAELIEEMQEWYSQIIHTPLHDGFSLHQLNDGEYRSEMDFHLSMADRALAIRKIRMLFESLNEPDLQIQDLNDVFTARYLTGSIDLVYFDGQRYHIADYKSNFLGDQTAHYNHAYIRESMSHSSYWLQAALYLVALHRYLKAVMKDYDMKQHLGGASYLYLRGMDGQSDRGVYHWKPADTFIQNLDAILSEKVVAKT